MPQYDRRAAIAKAFGVAATAAGGTVLAVYAIRARPAPVPPPPKITVSPGMVAPAGAGDNTPDGVWILNQQTLEWRTATMAEVKRGDVFDREVCRGKRLRAYATKDCKVWPGTSGKSYTMEAATIGELYMDDDGNAQYMGEDHRDFIERANRMYPGWINK